MNDTPLDTPNKPPGFFWTLTPDCQITKALDVASILLVESRNSPQKDFSQVVEVGSQILTHLKHISQIGSFLQVGVKIKHIWNHHLENGVDSANIGSLPHLRDDNTTCFESTTEVFLGWGWKKDVLFSHVPCLTWPPIWNSETPASLFFAFLESKPKRVWKASSV